MWLFTKYGFFSIVCARQGDGGYGRPVDTNRMMVRARAAEHLENLKANFPEELGSCEIVETHDTDYACRLFVEKSVWVRIAAELAEETDYDNFKSAVGAHLGSRGAEYVHRLHDVWSAMMKLQKR
jgi:hypothetical protein